MIQLFNIPNYTINTSKFSNFLHDKVVEEFEQNICSYVGAKYACSINSATNAIFLLFLNKNTTVEIPSIIPPVVANGLLTSGNKIKFVDDVDWVGGSYVLHDFGDYKIVDSAQKLERDQFKKECNDQDIMFFSFYPTKPVGSCDGGIIVSNDWEKIKALKEWTLNGMTYAYNNWERTIKFPGYKMYMNSIQAYIANENLKKLDEKYEKLNYIKAIYNQELGYNNSSNHLYRVTVTNNTQSYNQLLTHNIQCGIHYKALHLNPVYSPFSVSLPHSEIQENTTLSIPFNETLTDQEINAVIKNVRHELSSI
jgi:UDP-4-amino-4,6-dideoxy-L-N-acetyl-beta-L-altrosamine transaminase